MNILFTRFPLESRYGGAEVQTLSLMNGLRTRGHAVAFLGSCPTLLRLCREGGIPALELSIGPPPVTKWEVVTFLWRKKRMQTMLIQAMEKLEAPPFASWLRRGKRGLRLETVIMLSLTEKLLLTEHAATRGIRVLWIEHDRVGRWLTYNPWLSSIRRTSTYATTVCVSDLSRKMYLELGWSPQKTITIPNGVDVRRLQKIPQAGTPAADILVHQKHPSVGAASTLHVGTIARLSPEKGLDLLMEAVAPLPAVRLTIIGKGREEERLRALIQAQKLNERVTLQPDTPDLAAFYRSLDIFILPSRDHDPFGLSAAEAMILGIPTIVTDACGIAGYLRDGHDILITKAGDSGALKEGISRLSNPALRARIGEQGRKTAEGKFSVEKMVEVYEKVMSVAC